MAVLRILDSAVEQYFKMREKGSQLGTFADLKVTLKTRNEKGYIMTEENLRRTIDDCLLNIRTYEPADTRQYLAEKRSDLQYDG